MLHCMAGVRMYVRSLSYNQIKHLSIISSAFQTFMYLCCSYKSSKYIETLHEQIKHTSMCLQIVWSCPLFVSRNVGPNVLCCFTACDMYRPRRGTGSRPLPWYWKISGQNGNERQRFCNIPLWNRRPWLQATRSPFQHCWGCQGIGWHVIKTFWTHRWFRKTKWWREWG